MKKTICSALVTAAFCMSAPVLASDKVDVADTLITARQMLDVRTGKMIANHISWFVMGASLASNKMRVVPTAKYKKSISPV